MFHNTAYQLSNTNNSASERFFPESSSLLRKKKKRRDLTGVSGCSSNASWAHSPDQSLYSLILLRTVFWQVTQVPRWRACSLNMKGAGVKRGGEKKRKKRTLHKTNFCPLRPAQTSKWKPALMSVLWQMQAWHGQCYSRFWRGLWATSRPSFQSIPDPCRDRYNKYFLC